MSFYQFAGLCKTYWDNMTGFPAGDYEYIDVIVEGTRYILEVGLVGEFTIARPTKGYLSLLAEFPQIFVGKPDELKQVVKLMCTAAKDSLRSKDMHVPPWRRNGYMQSKWFGSYERLKNVDQAAARKASGLRSGKDLEGNEAVAPPPAIYHYYCRVEVAGKVGLRVGKLAQAFNGGISGNNIGNGI
ncbi:Protein of unknown function DUF506 [Macleaya cordata]|uniref:Uncharacterized protein n=1 Tax=Macleaya cordata TaxID=56857 RepID=A0A200RBF7_MACCD|nr:Protein of unknown function DUF506 [Macleaya cordata]